MRGVRWVGVQAGDVESPCIARSHVGVLECGAQFDALRRRWDASSEAGLDERQLIIDETRRVNRVWMQALDAQRHEWLSRHQRSGEY